MKAVAGDLPSGRGWAFEPKWDGHRTLVRIRAGAVDTVSSSGLDRSRHWPWMAAIRDHVAIPAGDRDVVLDGEVIAMDETGRHSFGHIGDPTRAHAFVVFDLLALGGDWLLDRPWSERRTALERTVTPGGAFLVTPTTDDGVLLWEVVRAQGFEGVIAKRTDSRYLPGGRSTSWRKTKIRHVQEFVVGGWLPGEGRRAGSIGSLLLGVHEQDQGRTHESLTFVGAVGSGFDDATLDRVHRRLRGLATPGSPFSGPLTGLTASAARGATFVEPVLVAQVEFGEWTPTGHLRHPVFLGLRDDVDPARVTRSP